MFWVNKKNIDSFDVEKQTDKRQVIYRDRGCSDVGIRRIISTKKLILAILRMMSHCDTSLVKQIECDTLRFEHLI